MENTKEQALTHIHCIVFDQFKFISENHVPKRMVPFEYLTFLSPFLLAGVTQTRPCNIQQYFTAVKIVILR